MRHIPTTPGAKVSPGTAENPGTAPKVSVVAPCYNEQDNIAALGKRVADACRAVAGGSYEIVLVNDGSKDDTWAAINRLAESSPNVVGVNLSRNYGHQLALSAGLSVARGERILIVDADLQDPPELLGEMMALMDDGADVVYGQRIERHGDSTPRKGASSVFYRLLRFLSDVDIPLNAGDFRLISRRVLDTLLAMPEHHRFIRGMISWGWLQAGSGQLRARAQDRGRNQLYPVAAVQLCHRRHHRLFHPALARGDAGGAGDGFGERPLRRLCGCPLGGSGRPRRRLAEPDGSCPTARRLANDLSRPHR